VTADPFPELTAAVDRLAAGQFVPCVLCQAPSGCVCPPFGTDAYFVLIDFRHGKITADDPKFRQHFRLTDKG
jgi:hypothetical protein